MKNGKKCLWPDSNPGHPAPQMAFFRESGSQKGGPGGVGRGREVLEPGKAKKIGNLGIEPWSLVLFKKSSSAVDRTFSCRREGLLFWETVEGGGKGIGGGKHRGKKWAQPDSNPCLCLKKRCLLHLNLDFSKSTKRFLVSLYARLIRGAP